MRRLTGTYAKSISNDEQVRTVHGMSVRYVQIYDRRFLLFFHGIPHFLYHRSVCPRVPLTCHKISIVMTPGKWKREQINVANNDHEECLNYETREIPLNLGGLSSPSIVSSSPKLNHIPKTKKTKTNNIVHFRPRFLS